tara:strand:+ start:176 stop:487 length:312 start_codon:yes stop_codon:yes gene_type:complete
MRRRRHSSRPIPEDEKQERVKKICQEAEALKRAKQIIATLQKRFPDKSLLQLLPVLLKHSGKAVTKVALERIKRNQAGKLSPEDQVFLQKVEKELSEETEPVP